tara:strand:+ start:743 stop:928 length:186 start_codon:yes stop_codon:yes gene_type:complete
MLLDDLDDLEYLKYEIDRIKEYSKYCYTEGITPKNVWYDLEDLIKQVEVIQKKRNKSIAEQ